VAVGMAAALVSLGLVGAVLRPLARHGLLGWVGLGIASALAHNLVQLAVVEAVLVRHDGFYFQLAPMAIWSLISGTITALMAAAAMPFWRRLFTNSNEPQALPRPEPSTPANGHAKHTHLWVWVGLALLALAMPWLAAQVVLFLCVAAARWAAAFHQPPSQRFKTLRQPLQGTWVLLLFMAWLHLAHGEGHLIGWFGWTREGLIQFGTSALRYLILALIGPPLLEHFPRAWLAQSASPYARGLCLALPALAALPAAIPKAGRHLWVTPGRMKSTEGKEGDLGPNAGWGERFAGGLAAFADEVMDSARTRT
jgi:hypothetical protein